MYSIGDIVKEGRIVQVTCADFYHKMINKNYNYEIWDNRFPDWNKSGKMVYTVKLNRPTKPYSFDEFCHFYRNYNYEKDTLINMYNEIIPTSYLSLPEDALGV